MKKLKVADAELLSSVTTRIQAALQFRRDEAIDVKWRRHIDLYRGLHFDTPADGDPEDKIAINVSKTVIDTIVPSLSLNYPRITVAARLPENEDNALIAESVLNYDFKRFDYKKPLSRSAKDSLILGYGVVKVGWRFVEDMAERSSGDMEADHASAVQEIDDYLDQNPQMVGQVPTDEQAAEGIPTTEMTVVADHATVTRVSPWDMFLDPEAFHLDDMGWLAQRCWMTEEEVADNEAWDKSARTNPPHASHNGDSTYSRRTRTHKERLVCVWEYWDLKKGITCTFAEGAREFLVKPRKSPYGFHPYEFLANCEVTDTLYPIGELDAVEPIQQELNKTRTQLMNARKHFGRKFLYAADRLSSASVSKLERSEDLAFVPIEEGFDLDGAIKHLDVPNITADLYQGVTQSLDDISLVSGRNEYQLGTESQRRRTATEASIINDVARTRATEKLHNYESFVGKVARKILMLNQKFLTAEQAVRIVGKDGAPLWFYFEPKWIEGEFDFEIEAGSTAPLNEGERRRQAMEFTQTMAPFMAAGIINQAMMAEEVLRAYGMKNPSRFMMAPPPMLGPDGQPMPPQGQPGMPGMPPGAPPGAPPMAGPQDVAQQGLDPALAGQLLGQVGLQVGSPMGPTA